ncbi:MAG: hypothetical protein JSW34_01735 [Candidatus Zixiibacteriota bacterium]|nr:MAG: hypothetical protein JSW34_01735 [candidate division Zixibacteria bacterium]
MSEPFLSIATSLSTMGGLALFIFLLTRKSFWKTRVRFKLTAIFFLSYTIFSLPGLFSWAGLHSPFGLVYAVFNYPLILLHEIHVIDLDAIERSLFKRQSLETANLAFGMVSIVFWTVAAYLAGGVIDLLRRRQNRRASVPSGAK